MSRLRIRSAKSAAFAYVLAIGFALTPLKAQIAHQVSPANPTAPPSWQIAAGGHMSFEVASVRLAEPGAQFRANVNLNMEDEPIPKGGRFSATASLGSYIALAYKFLPTGVQSDAVFRRLPKWATTDLFTIEAKAPIANPTKDQMRLMMQSLLAERFKLAVHFETHELPGVALVTVSPGKLGFRLRPHSQGPPCDAVIPPVDRSSNKIPEVWRPVCGDFQMLDWTDNTVILGSRNTTIQMLVDFLPALLELGRPVVDQTGLSGKFDYEVNFTPPWKMPKQQGEGSELDLTGPTFSEAMKEQLGLKLKPTKALIQTLVIDHVELPSPN